MASLSLVILTPQALQAEPQLRRTRPAAAASSTSTQADGSVRELIISTILFLLMAAAGLYGEILSHL